ncbi:MAG: Ig-like domain-containing protein, partial [Terriglobia bacterium]
MTLSSLTSRRVLAGPVLAILGLIQIGCGGGGGGSFAPGPAQNTAQTVSVSLSPNTAALNVGATQQFSATVTGTTNTTVSWAVSGIAGGSSTMGTVSSTGLYKAPSAVPSGNITVTATSVADSSASASSSVKITSPTSISISPGQATLATGAIQQFSATVTGASNTAVSWSVNGVAGGNSSVGTVSSTGLYTSPAAVPSPNPVTVTVTSVATPSQSASATITIATSGGSLSSLNPIVTMQNTQSLTLTVNGSGFSAGSQVQFNGASKLSTFVNSNQLTAQLS